MNPHICYSAEMNGEPLILRARYLFPATAPPLADGALTIVDGRIVSVGPAAAAGPVEDLGNVAILPGLINAHAHLDLSDVPAPLGRQGIGLPEWIGQVVAFRRQNPGGGRRAIERGLQECVRCGVTGAGRHRASRTNPLDPFAQAPMDGVVFTELIAPTARRVAPALELARQSLLPSLGNLRRWRPGLAPHAPYSVHPDLLRGAIEIRQRKKSRWRSTWPNRRRKSNCCARPMDRCGGCSKRWTPGSRGFRPGARPLDFLRLLARAHRTLVIHGNYLDDEEIGFLAENAAKMAVVYCPRTHAWFGHPPYPLEKMLAAGASVAVGTDSRASSPDLSLLAELRHIARSRGPFRRKSCYSWEPAGRPRRWTAIASRATWRRANGRTSPSSPCPTVTPPIPTSCCSIPIIP